MHIFGRKLEKSQFYCSNCMIDMCWCSIDNVVCKIDDPTKELVQGWWKCVDANIYQRTEVLTGVDFIDCYLIWYQ